jgi:hypothetical protein
MQAQRHLEYIICRSSLQQNLCDAQFVVFVSRVTLLSQVFIEIALTWAGERVE